MVRTDVTNSMLFKKFFVSRPIPKGTASFAPIFHKLRIFFMKMIATSSIYSTTNNTFSLMFVICRRKGMAINAMRFPIINSWWTIPAKNIMTLRTKLKMAWITTRTVITNYMVNNRDSIPNTFWDWFNKMSIHEAMNHLGFSSKVKYTVSSVLKFCCCPIPAFRSWLDSNFREYALQLIFCKNGFKIFIHELIIPNGELICKV